MAADTSALVFHVLEAITGLLLWALLTTLRGKVKGQEHVWYWAASWLMLGTGLLIVTPLFVVDVAAMPKALLAGILLVALIIGNQQPPIIVIATLIVAGVPLSRRARIWILAAGLIPAVATLAAFLALLGTVGRDQAVGVLTLSRSLYGLSIAAYAVVWIRSRAGTPTPSLFVTGAFLLAFAIHEMLYGLDRLYLGLYTNPLMSPVLGAFLPLGITAGLVLSIVEDIRAGERRFTRVWEASIDGLCLLDGSGALVKVNDAFCRMVGRPRRELESRLFTHLAPVGAQERLLTQFVRGFEAQALPSSSVWELHRSDGTRVFVEFSTSWVEDSGSRFLLLVCRDISERKRLEEEQRGVEAQLRQSQKMEAIGTLAGGIAHDFNNILSAIVGFTELVLDGEDPLSAEHRDSLTQVLKAGYRAKDLVGQILTFSRKGEHELQPVRLDLIVKETLRFLRASMPATVQIDLSVDPAPFVANADPTQVQQVVMNLSTNAAYAMRETGGALRVSLTRHRFDGEWASPAGERLPAGEYAKLVVQDTGPGIPAEIQARVFDPFFTTKPEGEGTGLGLSVVHGIVRGHRGAITLQSAPGQGCTFEIYIPLVADVGEDRQASPPAALPRGHGEWVLVVDDEADLVTLFRRMLDELGYQAVAETSPERALDVFRQQPELFKAVLTDHTMPGLTGPALAAEVRRLNSAVPVILCSGLRDGISPADASAHGVREMLLKPFSLQALANALEAAIRPAPGERPGERPGRQ